MDKRIIYPSEQGGVCLVTPFLECGIALNEIARKDVPAGVPYLILDAAAIPDNHEFFAAWEADFSSPDGYGIGAEAWFAEQEEKKKQEKLNDNSQPK